MKRRDLENLAFGLMFGFAAGIVVGILFAPDSGVRTRRRIAHEAGRLAESAKIVAERAEETAGVVHLRVDHLLGRDEEVAWRKVKELREGVERYTTTQPH